MEHLKYYHSIQGESPRVTRDEFEIIGHEKNWYLLQVKESILINKLAPELNDNISSVPLYLFN